MVRLSWRVPWVVLREMVEAALPVKGRESNSSSSQSSRSLPVCNHALCERPDGPAISGIPFREKQSLVVDPVIDLTRNQERNMTTSFYDTSVTTVDYQIIFTKRDFE